MPRSPALTEIERLDPRADCQRIVLLSCRQDFPFDTTRALELALFRTYGVPSIGGLLDKTGEFRRRAQQRYDDTDLLVSEVMEHGYDSERGQRAIANINRQHGRYPIRMDDFRYVLSTFVLEPIRWNAAFGWRALTGREQEALFWFWRAVGERMGITGVPEDLAAFRVWSEDYERRHYRYTEGAARVGVATRELFAGWFPRWLRPLVRSAVHGLIDEPLRRAFGMPAPNRLVRGMVILALRGRALVLRLLPKRRRPVLRTARRLRRSPAGWEIERIGPPAEPQQSPGGSTDR